MQITLTDFKKYCNHFLAVPKNTKKILAQKLGIETTYFSKLYNGKKPIPEHILERAKQLFSGTLPSGSTQQDQINFGGTAIDQLTRQIALLQGEIAIMRRDMTDMKDQISFLLQQKAKPQSHHHHHRREVPAAEPASDRGTSTHAKHTSNVFDAKG